MDDGADYRQAQELQEMQEWLELNKAKFNEIFGVNDESTQQVKRSAN